jgi:predicted transcriptional regulator
LDVITLSRVLADPTRWRILKVMVEADTPLMIVELAERVGCSADSMSKHMAVLRAAGIVTTGRNRLYQLQPRFIADQSESLLDFGSCQLRLKSVE